MLSQRIRSLNNHHLSRFFVFFLSFPKAHNHVHFTTAISISAVHAGNAVQRSIVITRVIPLAGFLGRVSVLFVADENVFGFREQREKKKDFKALLKRKRHIKSMGVIIVQ